MTDPQPLPSSTFKIKRVGCLFATRAMNLKNIVMTIIYVLVIDMTSWLIGLGHSDHPSSPVRAKVECYKSRDHIWLLGHGLLSHQYSVLFKYYKLSPTLNLIGGCSLTPLQRCSWCILQPQPTRWVDLGLISIKDVWKVRCKHLLT